MTGSLPTTPVIATETLITLDSTTIFGKKVDGYINYASFHTGNDNNLTGTADPGDTITLYVDGSKYSYIVAGTTVGTQATADASGKWSIHMNFLVTQLNRGIHAFSVTATNAAGVVSAASNTLTIYDAIYRVGTPTITAPANIANGYINASGYTGHQLLSGVAYGGTLLSIYDNGNLIGTTTLDGSTGYHWSFDLGALAQGAHRITAVASDAANNISNASRAIRFTVDTINAGPQNLADKAIVNGVVNAANDKSGQALTGTAEAGSIVSIYNHGTLLGTAKATPAGVWRYKLGHLADGSYSLTASSVDKAGNTATNPTALTFTVVTGGVAPAFTGVSYDKASGMATLTGTSAAQATVTVLAGKSAIGTASANAAGAWSFTTAVSSDAMQRFKLSATDPYGNTAASSGDILFGRSGNAALIGSSGNDLIFGLAGDTLTGGAGADTFVFGAGFGKETVTDFTPGSDILQFSPTAFADWAHLIGATAQQGSDLVITLDAADVITLKNVTLAAFTSASTRFA